MATTPSPSAGTSPNSSAGSTLRALDMGWKPGVLPIGVVFTFQPAAAQMAQNQPDRFIENTDLTVSNARMFMTCDDGPPVLVAALNPGGASMATQLEHLRFLGSPTRYAAIVGTAGAMVEGFSFGDVAVVASRARTNSIEPEPTALKSSRWRSPPCSPQPELSTSRPQQP